MAAAAPSFDALFGGAARAVNYEDAPRTEHDYLPVPEPTDSFQVVAAKLTALARVVERGASVAVHTGYKRAAHTTMDAEATARLAMTPTEAMQYDAWKKGAEMPTINWATDIATVPTGAGSAIRFANRAAAMNIIWKTDKATDKNAAWLTTKRDYMLPIVVAVGKVEGAKRDLLGGQNELSEMDMAEVQTIHRVCAVAMDRMNSTFQAMRKVSAELNAAKDVLQAREHALKSSLPEYKKKKDPINEARAAVGIPKIGRKVDYTQKTGGAREARTNLTGNTGLPPPTSNKRPRLEEPTHDTDMGAGMDY